MGPKLKLLAVVTALALVAAACGDDAEDTTTTTAAATTTTAAATTTTAGGSSDGTLEIGIVLPETGDLAVLGAPMFEAVRMALRDVNAGGGVLGGDVVLNEADSGTNEDVANAAVDRLLNDGVDAIVGAASSRITLSVIDKITGAGVVECSPSNTGSSLTTYPDNGFYFRTAPPDNLQGPALADVILGDGYADVAIIALNDEYGQGFARFLKEALEDGGATIVADVAYDPAGTNFDADVQQVADANPEAIALISFPDTGGQIIGSMIEQGIGPADVPLYLTDGMQSGTLYEKINPDDPTVTLGAKGTAPAAAPASGAAFFGPAFAEYAPGVDTIFSAHAYDCVVVISLAAEAAGSDDPAVFVDYMGDVTKGGEKCDTYAACKALLDAGTDIDYDGAAGALDFSDAGEPAAGTYDVYEFGADGSYAVIEQVTVGG